MDAEGQAAQQGNEVFRCISIKISIFYVYKILFTKLYGFCLQNVFFVLKLALKKFRKIQLRRLRNRNIEVQSAVVAVLPSHNVSRKSEQ